MITIFSAVEDDFYGWLIDPAAALKGQRYNSLDWKNLQAAALSLGHGLESDLEVLLPIC